MKIPFNKPPLLGNELFFIKSSLYDSFHSGGGPYTKKCQRLIEKKFNIKKSILTTSCTSALEVAAYLIDPDLNDEIIVPSYTFSSTVNAFVSRGMKPVYIDVKEDTLNIDENLIEKKITKKTKAIVAVHYAGIPAEMNQINLIAKKFNLLVIEDAAQAVNSRYHNKFAGSLSDMGTYSFHASKSYSCGEGGAITLNNNFFFDRVEYIVEKGTDRSLVINGSRNKYSWVDHGSSYLPSDILASLLFSQLNKLNILQEKRKKLFYLYQGIFEKYEKFGLRFIKVPKHVKSNFHAFWVLFNNKKLKDKFLDMCLKKNIYSYIGYIPLHSSKMGLKLGGGKFKLPVTESIATRVVRLPFFLMNNEESNYVQNSFEKILKKLYL